MQVFTNPQCNYQQTHIEMCLLKPREVTHGHLTVVACFVNWSVPHAGIEAWPHLIQSG